MKLKNILLAGASALILASCSNPTAKTLQNSGAKTPMDSINYLLGEQYASAYQQLEARDSAIFNTDKARQAYIKGMLDALNALKDGNDAYNEGYMTGIQLANNVLRTQKDVEAFKFDKALFGTGLAAGMDKKIEPTPDAQLIINRLMTELYKAQEAKDKEGLMKAMGEYAKKNGMTKIANADAFIKVVTPGNGAQLAEGDSIHFTMNVKADNGKDLSAYASKDNNVVLGKTLPAQHPYYQALLNMKSGEKAIVLLPASDVYGNYLEQIGLKPSNFLVIDLTADLLKEAAPKEAQIQK